MLFRSGQINHVAILNKGYVADTYIKPNMNIENTSVYYTLNDCIKAVNKGEVDATYLYLESAQLAVYKDVTANLINEVIPETELGFCIGIGNEESVLLASIINKAVNNLDAEEVLNIRNTYMSYSLEGLTVIEYLFINPTVMAISLSIIFLMLCLLILVIIVSRGRKKELVQKREMEYFISYICSNNDYIEELNYKTRKKAFYYIENQTLMYEKDLLIDGRMEELKDIHPEDIANVERVFKRENIDTLIHNCDKCRLKYRQLINQEYQWIEITLIGIAYDYKHPHNMLIINRNINEEVLKVQQTNQALSDALQIANAANEAKSSFMASITHEIRTPLNLIIGYLPIIECYQADAMKVKDLLKKVKISANHLLELLNNVLDNTSYEAGKMKINAKLFNIQKLADDISKMFEIETDYKGIKYEVVFVDLLHPDVIGDELRVRQIIVNLLSNALKFTEEKGCITLTIRELAVLKGKAQYQIAVTDTGIGMSSKELETVFEPFEQYTKLNNIPVQGTGLGLSITKNLVTLMGGVISVTSECNRGTTFTVSLSFELHPQELNLEIEEIDSHIKEEEYKKIFYQKRMLLIEDHPLNREIALYLFTKIGFIVEVACDGQEAIRTFSETEENYYQVILMDIIMPKMDGYEATKAIRKLERKDAMEIPILAFTANAFSEEITKALAAGMNGHISKPINKELTIQTLLKFL